jgi:hypothetical protein
MLLPVPIDKDFEPYGKRRVLPRNQDLFVDGGRAGGVAALAASVSPATGFCGPRGECPPGETCFGIRCIPN